MATPPAALSSCRSASERLCSVVVHRRCRSDLGLQREQLPLHQGGPTGLTCRPLVGSGHTLLAWPRLGRTCLCRALRRCHGRYWRPAEVAGPEDRIGRRDRHELAQAYTCTSDDCDGCQWPISECRGLPAPPGASRESSPATPPAGSRQPRQQPSARPGNGEQVEIPTSTSPLPCPSPALNQTIAATPFDRLPAAGPRPWPPGYPSGV
jgi:hypothetical protein